MTCSQDGFTRLTSPTRTVGTVSAPPTRCSRKRVERLMCQAGIQGIYRRRGRGWTRRDLDVESAEDLVNRVLDPEGPNRLWMMDVTDHPERCAIRSLFCNDRLIGPASVPPTEPFSPCRPVALTGDASRA